MDAAEDQVRPDTRALRRKIDPDILGPLVDDGKSLAEMVKIFADQGVTVTKQGVAYAKGKLTAVRTEQGRVLPWMIKEIHAKGWMYRAALAWALLDANRPVHSSDDRAAAYKLESWLRRADSVLRYDPAAPNGNPWILRDRRPSDDVVSIFTTTA